MIKIDNSVKSGFLKGGFGIQILHPGKVLDSSDSGIGTIGRIDHARVTPGTLVPMHPHKDDEILTYVRSGRIRHTDSEGHDEVINSTRLMLMNAGREFQHEELVLEGEDTTALQIFIRPGIAGLEPLVQFHEFETAVSENDWRFLAGPEAPAPLLFRSQTWIHDIRITAGQSANLPSAPCDSPTRLVYVFSGSARIDQQEFHPGEAAIVDGMDLQISAQSDSEIVLFTTDQTAPVYKGGMFSGNTN